MNFFLCPLAQIWKWSERTYLEPLLKTRARNLEIKLGLQANLKWGDLGILQSC
jgi:hypothetical protein